MVAAVYGFICHSTFLIGIGSMIVGIFTGLTIGRGPFHGWSAVGANAVLVLQFPVLHSLLLSQRGRRWTARLAPLGLGRDLVTTVYATIASLQLVATFLLWSPSGVVWWRAAGTVFTSLSALYGLAWLLLMKTMSDAGLAVQTGFLGWAAVARGRRPQFGELPVRGTFAFVRQPVYVAFSLTLWLAPVWTPDRLLLAAGWTAYCLIGPLFKEKRYRRVYGAAFESYQRLVPYWLPRLRVPGPAGR